MENIARMCRIRYIQKRVVKTLKGVKRKPTEREFAKMLTSRPQSPRDIRAIQKKIGRAMRYKKERVDVDSTAASARIPGVTPPWICIGVHAI
jgi:uncharacterized lipoprotein YehR (DUF1307 family)